ncbi:ABC transporter ATP-binding protein [Chelatococcus reniformis]|uniref:ABC transporter ATP-binding protein n=1 Tax=Chelatococcus reniformis TaxID=1494448 RepID=A0A916X889_9HYPH|nr:ABC transporter ATP-binding protein [Chelatococcus reniformis]GGC53620.1 ABC transporter ATP-binding protein [Chelatococcus reniformis]
MASEPAMPQPAAPQRSTPQRSTPLLAIEQLTVGFETATGTVHALDDVSFAIGRGECVALVGESGSGKSITGLAVMRLLGRRALVQAGRIVFDGADLLTLSEKAMQATRGKRVAMIFQNAKASLNPIKTVGDILVDILRSHHHGLSRAAARARIVALLDRIGINEPAERLRAYPSELSGGMCQRIMIAAAFACEPDLIIADEPTSALDVTTQQLVMDLLMTLCRERGVAAIFITHDLALASEYCDRAVVLHAGQVLEQGPVSEVLTSPRHPYTRMLLDSLPYGKDDIGQLKAMGGGLPDLRRNDLPCCRFAERCPQVEPACRGLPLPERRFGPTHIVRCQHPLEPSLAAAPRASAARAM